MKLTIIGSSDAFGSGGRLQTAFHVVHGAGEFLIDCGATTLLGLAREEIDPNRIDTIFITHLHGDHYAGLVWWLVHALHVARRTAPLTVTGPVGIEKRFEVAAEALYPGSTSTPRPFELRFLEYQERAPLSVGAVTVKPYEVTHPSGAPPYGLRFELESKVLAFSGDTEWDESLIPLSDAADLFIAECYAYDVDVRYHLSWRIIERELPRITARSILLTHMGVAMLAHHKEIANPRVTFAYDGQKIEL